ncbi:DeoR family transcriptional regulator [Symmachiella macrocystis]|nr:HTH domain-containing protein [Symmachiella macrocystis]
MNWDLMRLGTYPSDQLEEYGVDADRFKSWIGNPPNFLEFNLCDVVTLSIAVCSMLLNEVTARPTRMTTEPTGDAQSTPNEDETDATRTVVDPEPFESGRIVFFEDRVELCGVDICSGRRSTRKRQVLDLLKLQTGHQFIAYSGSKLAAEMSLDSSNSAAAVIRDLRKNIKELLFKQANLVCETNDVILSGGPGYRFSMKLSVHDGDEETGYGHDSRTTDDSVGSVGESLVVSVGDVGNSDVGNVGGQSEGTTARRRRQILALFVNGREVTSADVAQHFKCSTRTAERDLRAMTHAGKVEPAGSTRTGRYRLNPAIRNDE